MNDDHPIDPAEFELTCPACGGAMLAQHHGEARLDRCEDCAGAFVRERDLLHLVAAEAAHYTQPADQVLEAAKDEQRRHYDTSPPFLLPLVTPLPPQEETQ